jgi:hypothetical protein
MRQCERASQAWHDHHDRAMETCCKVRLCRRPVLSLFGPVYRRHFGARKTDDDGGDFLFCARSLARIYPGSVVARMLLFSCIYRKIQALDAARHRAAPPAAAVVAAALDH